MIRIKSIVYVILLLSPTAMVYASLPRDEGCNFDGDTVCPGAHPGAATTSQRALTDSTTAITTGISKAVALTLSPKSILGGRTALNSDTYRTTGYAAGGYFTNAAGWLSYVRTTTDNTKFFTESDGNLDSALVGLDFSPRDNMVLGLTFGYENNDITTKFNVGEQRIHGFTIAPYVGFLFHPNFSVDASAGYSSIDIDQTRLDTVNLTSIIDGDTDSDRWFVSGNLNAFTRVRDFAFSGRVGIVYAEEDIDAIVETGGPDAFTTPSETVEFGQLQAGGEVAYSVASIEPYASVFYEHDFEFEKVLFDTGLPHLPQDRSDVRFGLGARYFSDYGFSANLEWSIITWREGIDSHTLGLTGRLEF